MQKKTARFCIQKELQTLKILLPEVILFFVMFITLAIRILAALLF